MKTICLCDVALRSLVEVYRRFRGAWVLMMESANTSEKSVNLYQTTGHNIPDDSHLQAIRGFLPSGVCTEQF
jgi:hypothetical protein